MLDLIENSVIGDVTKNLAITQGKTYILSFNYPGDMTSGILRGQIRSFYLEDLGTLLANFSFTTSYDANNDHTLVTAILSANSTAAINYTKYQGRTAPTAKNCHVYDIEYENNGEVAEILRGLVQVKPEVTGLPNSVDLPNDDNIATKISIVEDLTERNLLVSDDKDLVFVRNASLDNTVTSGSSLYLYDKKNLSWIKLVDSESIDVIINEDPAVMANTAKRSYPIEDETKLSGIESSAQVNTVDSVNGLTGVVNLTKNNLGLDNVDNTSDINKPISSAVQLALNNKSNILHDHLKAHIIDFDEGDYATSTQGSLADTAVQPSDLTGFIESNPGVFVATQINNIIAVSQGVYDSIASPDPNTYYIITG